MVRRDVLRETARRLHENGGRARNARPIPWILGTLALVLVFGLAWHVLVKAYQSLRRGIPNQHVMLEIGAFAGIVGGFIGLVVWAPGYPTAAFFGVAVMVATYHLFSEWLSLIVKTRSSRAKYSKSSAA